MTSLRHRLLVVPAALALWSAAPAQDAFFVDHATGRLYALDLGTGQQTAVGSLGLRAGDRVDLAWRRDAQELWMCIDNGEVGVVDPTSGNYTARFQTGLFGVTSMTWDVRTQRFYLESFANLHSLDPATGALVDLGFAPPASTCAADGIGALWSYDYFGNWVLTVDAAKQSYTRLARPQIGFWSSIAVDDQSGTIYALSTGPGQAPRVVTVDPATGASVVRHTFGPSIADPGGFELAEYPDAYTVDYRAGKTNRLLAVDFTTRATHVLGDTGVTLAQDITWRADTKELWLLDANGRLGTLNRFTGAFSQYDYFGGSWWASSSIAWDGVTQRFYMMSLLSLTSYDPATKTLINIGPGGPGPILALDTDPSGSLIGTKYITGQPMFAIDKGTGARTYLGAPLSFNASAFAFSPELGELYALSPADGEIYRVDPLTGARAAVMQVPNAGFGLEVLSTPSTGLIERRGQGCTDSTGTTLRLLIRGQADIGRSVTVDLLQGANQPYVLNLGASATVWGSIPLPLGLASLGAAPTCQLLCSLDGSQLQVPASWRVTLKVPNAPSIVGAQVFWQAVLVDPALSTRLPIATSDMIAMTIGR